MSNNNQNYNQPKFDPSLKEQAEIIGSMSEDQRQFLMFVLRQIELSTDFAKWFKASRTMSWKQRFVFDKKVNEALRKKEHDAKENS